jgi:MFS family permease
VASWAAIAILAAAQFVMVLDSSVMNVSISQIVEDLDTTVQGVQLAITLYTLVMASLMLVGAKLGDILGRDRSFALGLAIYGVGSLTTALSPNLGVLLVGWSLVEGIGAVLVIPAIAALIAANYEGPQRALAYGVIGGVAAAAIAAGPLIGGWVTTTWTWRVVFAAETVIVIGILLLRGRMKPSPRVAEPPKLDYVGATLSALALLLIVLGVLQSSSWGWVQPKGALELNGVAITPLGLSMVLYMILSGLGLLWAFGAWEARRTRQGKDILLDTSLLSITSMRAGLASLFVLQLVLLGTFFVLPVFLQVVSGLNAFETGLRLVPMSITMLVCALAGPRIAARRSPRRVVQGGLVGLAVGIAVVLASINNELTGATFGLGLAIFGGGAGLVASQLGNVIMSSVGEDRSNEAGGLQGTAQNLGASFGTALIGAILLTGLTAGFVDTITHNDALPVEVRSALADYATASGLDIVTAAQAEEMVLAAGLPADQAAIVAADYEASLVGGLQNALAAVAVFALLGLWFTRNLPQTLGGGARAAEEAITGPAGQGSGLAGGREA